jgi:hypothetical protein
VKTLAPLVLILVILLALVLAARIVHADDGGPWVVFQDGHRCCQFFDLPSATEFVRMQTEHGGNSYIIVFVKN